MPGQIENGANLDVDTRRAAQASAYQHGTHAEFLGDDQIADAVLDHDAAPRVEALGPQQGAKSGQFQTPEKRREQGRFYPLPSVGWPRTKARMTSRTILRSGAESLRKSSNTSRSWWPIPSSQR